LVTKVGKKIMITPWPTFCWYGGNFWETWFRLSHSKSSGI